jgi:hypothetical protein
MSHDVADFTPSNLVFPAELLARFFDASPGTQEQCNSRLYDLCRSQSLSGVSLNWHPDRQGCGSYTVFIDTTNFDGDCIKLVAQFRRPGEELKLTTVFAAIDSYGERFVPQVSILDDFPMQLAIAEYGGESFANQGLAYNSQHRRTAVEDLASFLSAPFHHPQLPNGEVKRLITLLRTWSEWKISPRVDAIVKKLYKESGIAKLSTNEDVVSQMPIVLTHVDLNTCNILSDSNGHITKIVDWVEAENQPFGMSLFRVEGFLGGLTNCGYDYHPEHNELREHFWDCVLKQLGYEEPERLEVRQKFQVVSDIGILVWMLGSLENDKDVNRATVGYLEALLCTTP